MENAGLSFTEIGMTQAVFMFLNLAIDFPTGGLADRYGRRLNYAVGMLLYGFGILTISLSKNFIGILTGFMFCGVGSAFMSGSFIAWFYDAAKDEKLAYKVFSKAQILEGVMGASAGIVASTLSSILLNLPLILSAIVAILTFFLTILLLNENYGHGGEKNYWNLLKDGAVQILENRILNLLIISGFFMSFVLPTFMLYWIILAQKYYNLPSEYAGGIYSFLVISMSIGGVISTYLSKKTDYKKIAIVVTVLWGFLFAILPLSTSLIQVILILVFVEILYAIRMAAMSTFENAIIPTIGRAATLSALGTIISAFSILANTMVGIIADKYGVKALYQCAGVFALSSALCLFLAFLWSKKRR
jgi:MFS family permease